MEITNGVPNHKYTTLEEKVKFNFTVMGIFLFTISFIILKSFIPYQISYLLLGASFIVLLFSKLIISRRGIILTRVDMMWFLFLMIFIINITSNHLVSRGTVSDLLIYVIGTSFLLFAKANIDDYKYSLRVIKISGLIYGLSAIFQYLYMDLYMSKIFPLFSLNNQESILFLLRENSYSGFSYQTAHLAGYVLSALGIFIFLNWNVKLSTKIFYILCIIVLFIAMLLSSKRAHLIFMVIALSITILFSLNNKKIISSITKVAVTFLATILLIFLLYNSFDFQEDSAIVSFVNELEETFTGIVEGKDVSNGRSVLFAYAWDLFKENPIMGIGWNEYINNSLGLIRSDSGSHPHNIYLQLLAEFGLIGFLSFMLPVLYLYYKTFKLLRFLSIKSIALHKWKTGIQFSFYSQTFFLLYGMTGNLLTDYNFLLLYFFACSISLSAMTNLRVYQTKIDTKNNNS